MSYADLQKLMKKKRAVPPPWLTTGRRELLLKMKVMSQLLCASARDMLPPSRRGFGMFYHGRCCGRVYDARR
jgi:hypothetical protein